jgi:regulator of sigma E protease
METLIKILQLILSLSLLVFVHELGHYLTARMFKIRVEKFFLFFDVGGISLFKFKIGETTFGLGWLPFGGYCKISGMIDESLDTKALKQPAQPWEFRSKPAWQRLIVMVGGVVMNAIAACIIYIGMSWHWGESYVDNKDLRWGYSFNELGHRIGFRDGDRVVSIDGAAAEGDFTKIYMAIVLNDHTTVGVERDGRRLDVDVTPEHKAELLQSAGFMRPRFPFVVGGINTDAGVETPLAVGDSLVAFNGVPMSFVDEIRRAMAAVAGEMSPVDATVTVVRDSVGVRVERTLAVSVLPGGMLGVPIRNEASYFPVHTIDYTFAEAIPAGFRQAGKQIGDYWKQLKMIFSPRTEAYKSVGSLITIGNLFPGRWQWYPFWYWTAFLSIILAVMNILPIPALDGGHVMFLVWEVVTRRRPSDKFLEHAQMVGMVLLLALLILAFWNDIYRFFLK